MIRNLLHAIETRHELIAGEFATWKSVSDIQQVPVDLIVLYHTVEKKISRVGSLLPIENANSVVQEMCERIPIQEICVPVFAGICGSEPVRFFPMLFKNLLRTGVIGVQNFPSIGMIDGTFRYNLESVHLGAKCEEDTMATAIHNGLEIIPFVFNQYEALAMAKAGAKIIILDLGFRSWDYDIHAEMAQYMDRIQSIGTLMNSLYPEVKLLVYSMYREIEQYVEHLLPQMPYVAGLYRSIPI